MVLAAGVATTALAAPLGVNVPVEPSPCPLLRLRAPAGLVRTVVNTQDFDLRHVAADRLITAADSPDRTLAVGRLVARELVDCTVESTLTGCRLNRFYSRV